MPALVPPNVAVRASFLAAMAEFTAEGRGGDGSMIGHDLARYGGSWETEPGFATYVEDVAAASRADTPRREGWVASTTLWWVEEPDVYLGRLAIRHRLNDWLLEQGGHIGYDVRRSRRRQGHATAMLRACLPAAHDLGIDPALVTCDETNLPSRRVIEAAGGELEDQRGAKLRFWVSTSPAGPGAGPPLGMASEPLREW